MEFEFATAARIVFGRGVIRQASSLVGGLGVRPLLVTGRSAERGHRVLDGAESFRVDGEPTIGLVEAGAELARSLRCDVVVGVGGGSALDAAKAIAALAVNPGPALEYLEVIGRGRPLGRAALPVVAAPTTAGTGSEVTRNAVLSSPGHGVKVSLRHISMLPKVALVDPDLMLSLPAAATAATGLDALTQLIEPYVSVRATAMTDPLCREGIPRVGSALCRAFDHPGDVDARTRMALGALLSGMALANAGLGAVHGFAAVLGGRFAAPHGALCAALLPAAMRVNVRALRERHPEGPYLDRYREVAVWLGEGSQATAESAALAAGRQVERLLIPRLSQWGVRPADVPEAARLAEQASSMKGNPVKLTRTELEEILESAI